jgi:hypothetical protein
MYGLRASWSVPVTEHDLNYRIKEKSQTVHMGHTGEGSLGR